MPRVRFFDISVEDPEEAIRFYTNVFNWQIEKWDGPRPYWLIKTGDPTLPGIDGGMGRRKSRLQSVTNFIDVPSIDEYAMKIEEQGGLIVQPKTAIKGVGHLVAFEDMECNMLAIMEYSENAN